MKRLPENPHLTNAVRILAELDDSEVEELFEFAAKIKGATALVVHPEDLETCRWVLGVLGRPDLELFEDHRLEPGMVEIRTDLEPTPHRLRRNP